jgi:D-threo-aldose 1-dehydrogenase
VRRALEGSLERLGLDRVDVVLVHDPDEPAQLDQTIAEAVPELLRMREEGTIRAVGAGMNFPGPLARIVRDTDVDCVLVAGRHTLLDRSAAAELLPLCAERAVGVIAGGVFNSGILADPGGAATYEYAPAPAALLQRARAIAAVCARHDVTLPAAAMAFARRHPAVTCLLVGARSSEEVAANVEAFGRPVPDALWSELEAERLLPDGVAA